MISMVVEGAGSKLNQDQPLVYVEYVGVAPENLHPPVGNRELAGLGTLLIHEAVMLAQQLGFAGRVGLHSKEYSEALYRRLHFTALQRESTEDGRWLYFELAAQDVQKFLSG